MYYAVIKHDRHLRTRGKCRNYEVQASVFYISRVFSNVRSVLSQCNTRFRLLHLLYDIDFIRSKKMKPAFSMFYTLINAQSYLYYNCIKTLAFQLREDIFRGLHHINISFLGNCFRCVKQDLNT